jgi:hypothetical protein
MDGISQKKPSNRNGLSHLWDNENPPTKDLTA